MSRSPPFSFSSSFSVSPPLSPSLCLFLYLPLPSSSIILGTFQHQTLSHKLFNHFTLTVCMCIYIYTHTHTHTYICHLLPNVCFAHSSNYLEYLPYFSLSILSHLPPYRATHFFKCFIRYGACLFKPYHKPPSPLSLLSTFYTHLSFLLESSMSFPSPCPTSHLATIHQISGFFLWKSSLIFTQNNQLCQGF